MQSGRHKKRATLLSCQLPPLAEGSKNPLVANAKGELGLGLQANKYFLPGKGNTEK